MAEKYVASYSQEWAIKDSMPIYSGGLGVLMGCLLASYADLGYPVVGVGLMRHKGYFKQKIVCNSQEQCDVDWNPEKEGLQFLPNRVKLKLYGQDIMLGAWKYTQKSELSGKKADLILLDTNVPENPDWAKEFSYRLYDDRFKLINNIMLGIGGKAMLEALGYDIKMHHMQEGHSALVTLKLLKEFNGNEDKVREICALTNHTPKISGMPIFEYCDAYQAIDYLMPSDPARLAGFGRLNTNILGTNMSCYTNAVSELAANVLMDMPEFAGKEIDYITNGVHHRFFSKHLGPLIDRHFGTSWRLHPEILFRKEIGAEELDAAHRADKKDLVDLINEHVEPQLRSKPFNEDNLLIGFAKRFHEYKRPTFLMSDETKLADLQHEIQIAYAGKAHPNDGWGKDLLSQVINTGLRLNHNVRFGFIPDYNMEIGKLMTAGSDLWVISARPLEEASGTSGIKIGMNGNKNISTNGGFWPEVEGRDGRRGYTFGGRNESEEVHDFHIQLARGATDFKSEKLKADRWDVIRYFWNNFSAIRMAREYGYKVYGFEKKMPVRLAEAPKLENLVGAPA